MAAVVAALQPHIAAATAVAMVYATAAHAAGVANPEEFVNTLGGSDSKYDLSHGNIMPDLTMPWGFNAWAPQSNDGKTHSEGEGWWFYSEDRRFFGIRCTHQPSPWIGDYGQLRFAGGITDPEHQDEWLFSAYEPKDSAWYPYYQNFTLLQFGARTGYTTVETAPTEHGVVINWNFPKHATGNLADGWNQTRRVWVSLNGKTGQVNGASTDSSGLATMGGYTKDVGNGRGKQFKHHYHATVAGGADGKKAVKPFSTGVEDGKWAWMDFDSTDPDTETLVMRVATSLISPEQAQLNHKTEVEQIGLADAKAAAKDVWNKLLSKISVDDVGPGYTPQQESDWLTGFYSSLYRAAKFPRKLFEQDANGNNIHYSPNTGKVLPGVLSADQGFWDAYRTTYSLLSVWDPKRMSEMMAGWLSQFQESGWIPEWSAPGGGGGMTGTMSDVSLSEAIIKLPHCGTEKHTAKGYCVNASALYLASRKNALVSPPKGSTQGRVCLDEYHQLGYIPQGCSDADVSRSMNYWHSDYALAQAATQLAKTSGSDNPPNTPNVSYTADAKQLLAASKNWIKLLDPKTGHFRVKDQNGSFLPTFDEFAWGPEPGYTEAGPWQYRVEVPYDPQGLQAAFKSMGYDGCDIIQEANTILPIFHDGGYGSEIHEMSEMAINCWGQWELDNQPVWILQHMQVAFDNSVTGKCAGQAQKWLRESNSMLHPGADMYPGDEDNGSMGAWFVMNMLGFYPVSPASGNYTIGSPMFAKVSIDTGGKPFIISAKNQSPDNVYVQSLTWNGQPFSGTEITYESMMEGGTLEFTMGSKPAFDIMNGEL